MILIRLKAKQEKDERLEGKGLLTFVSSIHLQLKNSFSTNVSRLVAKTSKFVRVLRRSFEVRAEGIEHCIEKTSKRFEASSLHRLNQL